MNKYLLGFLCCAFFPPSPVIAQPLYPHGVVATEHFLATKAGVEILRNGGNAIDAAVAVGYVLAVVNPCCGNIGGGGFMTIHFADGKNLFVNFREKAPLNASQDMYRDKDGQMSVTKSITGYLAVAVPGTVLGFDTVLKNYGTLKREVVMNPAIQLAENGFVVTDYLAKQLSEFESTFATQPNIAAIFLKNGKTLAAGEKLIQKNLAHTLKEISLLGPDYFYNGPIAQAIVTASQQHGGILSLEDFAKYTIVETNPLYCTYHGYQIISAPPPSSGGVTLCEMLNILENFPIAQLGINSVKTTLILLDTMHFAFLDRNKKLGDPAFVVNPIAELTSKAYAKKISEKIQSHYFRKDTIANTEKGNTTHYSVLDKYGNAVSVTYTLNGYFGANVMAGDTGFFLNDEMDDFAKSNTEPNQFGLVQSGANLIAPGKRPLSSTTPTIVLKDNKIFLIIGSPGGPRIITTVLLSLLNVIDFDLDLQTAIDLPRFHYQVMPDWVDYEPFALTTLQQLGARFMGYEFNPLSTWGAVEAIGVNRSGQPYGANDSRRPDGAAMNE